MPASSKAIHERARLVAQSASESFVELIRIAELDPRRDLRFSNWSGISFKGLDLRGFDFTGSRLVQCDFAGARIKDARFEGADIKWSDPKKAKDWAAYAKAWTPPREPIGMRHLRVGAEFQDAPLAPRMVIVPQGEFQMGSPEGEGDPNQHPQHPVTIGNPFAVGVCPVTRGEFAAFVKARGHKVQGSKKGSWLDPGFRQNDDHPVVMVSWHDAQAYVAWLRESSGGRAYRLLSEAEWEYCCRAGTASAYSTGESITPAQANFEKDSTGTTSVREFPPSPWGLHDMHGNVWEWCEDNWHKNYTDNPPSNGLVWQGGDSSFRVLRGGSWGNGPGNLRSAYRNRFHPGFRSGNFGFRVARTL
jgi:formylglycine-generating enzyme required for sulfatase activity